MFSPYFFFSPLAHVGRPPRYPPPYGAPLSIFCLIFRSPCVTPIAGLYGTSAQVDDPHEMASLSLSLSIRLCRLFLRICSPRRLFPPPPSLCFPSFKETITGPEPRRPPDFKPPFPSPNCLFLITGQIFHPPCFNHLQPIIKWPCFFCYFCAVQFCLP